MVHNIIIVLSWFGSMLLNQTMILPNQEDGFIAVKYKVYADYSTAKHLMPGLPENSTSYCFFINYGNDTYYEINDPGSGLPSMPVMIIKWDYQSRILEWDSYFTHVQIQYNAIDTIDVDINQFRGKTVSLCDSTQMSTTCDSVIFTSSSSGKKYNVHFDSKINNLKFLKLLYPDIKYLPTKITRVGRSTTTLTQEDTIIGKEAIDSLINSYRHDNYNIVSKEEINSYPLELPDHLINKF